MQCDINYNDMNYKFIYGKYVNFKEVSEICLFYIKRV